MQIHITKNGQQFGPYSEEEVGHYIGNGQFSVSDLAWCDGKPDWVPLSQLISFSPAPISTPPPVPPPRVRPADGAFSDAEIIEIASRQKAMIWLILGSIVALFIPFAPLITGILSLIFIYHLARAVRSSVAWLYAVVALIPLIGLIPLLMASSKATSALRSRNIRVGLMGANQSDLNQLKA